MGMFYPGLCYVEMRQFINSNFIEHEINNEERRLLLGKLSNNAHTLKDGCQRFLMHFYKHVSAVFMVVYIQ